MGLCGIPGIIPLGSWDGTRQRIEVMCIELCGIPRDMPVSRIPLGSWDGKRQQDWVVMHGIVGDS